ncbi:MAG TPA: dihydrolipoamide acetyltransferase family protein [Streptosporangiaceae bacterium]|nr:dihydrolipoamide acetyltransferase family protein [Streptosporangiaceae bacterium]
MNAHTFVLPDLGEGLTEAELVRWLVAEGDEVVVDQPVAEVETAKAVVEVPTPFGGRVTRLHAKAGQTIDVGTPLLSVEPPGDGDVRREEGRGGSGNVLVGYGSSASGGSGRRRRPRAAAQQTPARQTPAQQAPARQTPARQNPAQHGRVPRVASPLVRRRARERGVDIGVLEGTGPGGLITGADVERAVRGTQGLPSMPSPGTGERRTPLNGFQKAMSSALTRSRSEIPEATVWVDVDATALVELRESARRPSDPGPGLLSYLARFVVMALKEYPVLNSRLDTERQEIVEFDRINLGIAAQGRRGLVVPVIMGAESLSTAQLDERIRDVTRKAREGQLAPEDLTGGTFTFNNYGVFGVDGSAAIIHHPQVAILGLGRIIDRPWAVNGEIRVRKIAQMSFVFDHRICDGGTAAGFMRSVADAIENPAGALARL